VRLLSGEGQWPEIRWQWSLGPEELTSQYPPKWHRGALVDVIPAEAVIHYSGIRW